MDFNSVVEELNKVKDQKRVDFFNFVAFVHFENKSNLKETKLKY